MNALIVDDELPQLGILEDMLKEVEADIRTDCFQNPLKALEHAKTNPVDVAFLDIEMPVMNGILLGKKLKKLYPMINIIFTTGYSEFAVEAFSIKASGYLLKPISDKMLRDEMDSLRFPVEPKKNKGIYAVTFGSFELLADGNPVHFSRKKSKEIFAYLVDRKGAFVSRKQIAEAIFEDSVYDRKVQDYLNKLLKEMFMSLDRAGAGNLVLKKTGGFYAVDISQFGCDRYDYEQNIPEAINSFHGSYMQDYAWGEYTLGALYE